MICRPLALLTLVLLLGSGLVPLLTVEEAEGQVAPEPYMVGTDPSFLWLDARVPEQRTKNVSVTIHNPTNSELIWDLLCLEYSTQYLIITPSFVSVTAPEQGSVTVNISVSPGPLVANRAFNITVVGEENRSDDSEWRLPQYTGFQVLCYDRDLFVFSPDPFVVKMRPGTEEKVTVKFQSSYFSVNEFTYILLNEQEMENSGITLKGLSPGCEYECGNQSSPDLIRFTVSSSGGLSRGQVQEFRILATSRDRSGTAVISFFVIMEGVSPTMEFGILLLGFLVLLCPFLPAVKRKLGPGLVKQRKQALEKRQSPQKTAKPSPSKEPDNDSLAMYRNNSGSLSSETPTSFSSFEQ